MRHSWVKQVSSSRKIILITSHFNGRDAYYFLAVVESKEKVLNEALQASKALNLKDYGEIVASGWGNKPSRSVIDRLKIDYDVDFSHLLEEDTTKTSTDGEEEST